MRNISILFVCVGNACRSQMAEGLARSILPRDAIIYSAGTNPAGFVAKDSITVMREKGIDISSHDSKGLDEIPAIEFDYIVGMGCGPGPACPSFSAKKRVDWQIPDPFGGGLPAFRKVRDLIEKNIRDLLRI